MSINVTQFLKKVKELGETNNLENDKPNGTIYRQSRLWKLFWYLDTSLIFFLNSFLFMWIMICLICKNVCIKYGKIRGGEIM